MINLNIKNQGMTNSRQFIKEDKYDLEALLKNRQIMERIVDLKNCNEKDLRFHMETCFSAIYTFVKVAREVEKSEDFWTDIK